IWNRTNLAVVTDAHRRPPALIPSTSCGRRSLAGKVTTAQPRSLPKRRSEFQGVRLATAIASVLRRLPQFPPTTTCFFLGLSPLDVAFIVVLEGATADDEPPDLRMTEDVCRWRRLGRRH
ncbi:hypothetical protein Dimus_010161, partial [Dionaea muscipula]